MTELDFQFSMSPAPLSRGWLKLTAFLAALTLVCAIGCRRNEGPPPPLPAEQIPMELKKSFGQASPEIKGLVGEIERALESKDYPAAYQRVLLLCNLSEATKEQRLVATRAMLTLTASLRAAQVQGDANAAAVLQAPTENQVTTKPDLIRKWLVVTGIVSAGAAGLWMALEWTSHPRAA